MKEPTKAWQRQSLRKIMIAPSERAFIDEVAPQSPAATAGLRQGDEITTLNGAHLNHWQAIADSAEQHPTDPMTLTIRRGTNEFSANLTPAVPVTPSGLKPQTGIMVWRADMKVVHPGVGAQIKDSVNAMVATFDAIFAKKSDIKAQHLGSAVKIASVYYMLFQNDQGWRLALWFSVVLNVNLALLNLLPFPILDGGHIVLALIEAVRRKPVSGRVLNVLMQACAFLLIGYMLYVTFYDVQDLPWRRSQEKEVPIQFAPAK